MSSAANRTVHVVDDDAAVRWSLDRLLRSAGFETVLYESPGAFIEGAEALTGGCVLADIRMPGMDGLEMQATLKKMGVDLPIIIMTGYGDVTSAVSAMKGGAIDFLEKPFADWALFEAIETALAGAGVDTAVQQREISDAARQLAKLSPREREVLSAITHGLASKEIAYRLGISVRTVEVHRARMLRRLDARHIAEAIRLAVLAALPPPMV